MKTKEFHKMVRQQGWRAIRQNGSHVVYEKNGKSVVVPYHGAKEFPEGLRKSLIKLMGLQ